MQGKKKEKLTPESILEKIDAYTIYRHYIGKDFPLNKAFHSPMPGRRDKHPSFLIGTKHGVLKHKDFADSNFEGNCFKFVMQMFNLDFPSALAKINRDFSLGIGGNNFHYDEMKERIAYEIAPIVAKKHSLIQVRSRRFDASDLAYWELFGIGEETLKEENIYAIKEAWCNGTKLGIKQTELAFGYLYDDKWKIYRPYADKKHKWLSNVPNDRMDGLENIISCDKAIITKSKKDKIVLKQIFPYVCSVQSESKGAINQESLLVLQKNAKEIYVNFDSDATGKKTSMMYTTDFGFKHINVPDEYLPIKDFADLARYKGIDVVREYLKTKELL